MSELAETAVSTAVPPSSDTALLHRLRAVPILASIPAAEIACLTDGELIRIAPGHFLGRQGEVGHNFWILLAGSLRVFKLLPDGREALMKVLPAGSAFGEMPLLTNIPNVGNVAPLEPCELLQFDEQQFWNIMTSCPEVRKAILSNMAIRFQGSQSVTVQQEKMASLGTLAAGLMHELNNPGTAAVRAAAQLRDNLLRMHQLTAKFSKAPLKEEQKQCMFDLQEFALSKPHPQPMNSLEQSDAEEALAEWMESADIADAWKLAPTLVAIGITSCDLECARAEFPDPYFSDALNWLEALVSSMQLVGTIEESIGRVSDLVKAVKSYAYEGRGQKQSVDINESIHATLVILGHKLREKQITLQKDFAANLPVLQCECSGLNQIWTNLLDNAIDAVPQGGHIRIRTWQEDLSTPSESHEPPNSARQEESTAPSAKPQSYLCITLADDGPGIPLESQPQIFDPFYTTKPVGVGTGLGLGIVQRIVEQYRGTITFSSEPGNTEFRIRLPLTRD
ncbi:MAG TPA: ATP-binding protein [Acidobacteriaceae bacterium]|nr:ATP-binding protein [Acidobacteriaceae bacterium]